MQTSLFKEYYLKETNESFDIFFEDWWKNKCSHYKKATPILADYYDIFFSRFVVYNALYNIYTDILKIFDKKSIAKKEIRFESVRAIQIVAERFDDVMLQKFFEPEQINDSLE